jgi:sortase B
MKKKLRTLLLIVLAGVFSVSAFMLVRELLDYREGQETYSEAEQLAGIPDFTAAPAASASADASAAGSSSGAAAGGSSGAAPAYVDPYAEQLRKMDFSALQKLNSDVLGWILIPGSVISYPVLQTSNNTYYLTHTWKKASSAVGAIFLESRNKSDFSNFNTVVYGHNMNNGSMFGSLKKYKSKSWWRAHPIVYITDRAGSRAYQIFAAYEVSTAGTTYQIGFPAAKDRQAFLDYCVGQSVIQTGVTPTIYDKIVTLSTCTGHGHATRWVIQARLKGTAPAKETPAPQAPATSADDGAAASAAAGSAPAESSAAAGAAAAQSAASAAAGEGAAAQSTVPAENAGEAGGEIPAGMPAEGADIPAAP